MTGLRCRFFSENRSSKRRISSGAEAERLKSQSENRGRNCVRKLFTISVTCCFTIRVETNSKATAGVNSVYSHVRNKVKQLLSFRLSVYSHYIGNYSSANSLNNLNGTFELLVVSYFATLTIWLYYYFWMSLLIFGNFEFWLGVKLFLPLFAPLSSYLRVAHSEICSWN